MTLLRQARLSAGLTIEAAARSTRVSVDYLRRIELSGDCSYPLAMRLSRVYSCSANVFIQQRGQAAQQRSGGGAAKGDSAPRKRDQQDMNTPRY